MGEDMAAGSSTGFGDFRKFLDTYGIGDRLQRDTGSFGAQPLTTNRRRITRSCSLSITTEHRTRNLMAKITVPLLPQATEEYDQSQMAQLVQTLDQLIFALNNTYTSEPLRNDDEAIAWFLG
jgi:hypothetical protein